VIAARRMRRVAGGMDRAQAVVHRRGGLAVLLGRFVAILRALMPAVAGTTRMPYRTFLIYNMLGGLIWGVGYCLLGYVAGSAYAAIERTVGTGVAIVVAVAALGGVGFWLVRRHRREQAVPDPAGPDVTGPDVTGPEVAGPDPAVPDVTGPGFWRVRMFVSWLGRNALFYPGGKAFVRRYGPGPGGLGLLNQHAGKISSPGRIPSADPDEPRV
jgi:hypothetical protein